jgi:type III restriction enzyme
MRFMLKDYQVSAVAEVLRNLTRAREDYQARDDLVAFSLSATTGAGKTVMAAAVLEALFEGAEDFEADPDPTATVLWVTDDPSLNEQTRYRLLESGDRLPHSRLKVVDTDFDQQKLAPKSVYFLNIHKLAAGTSWVKHSNQRTFTLWETIENTVRDPELTLYLVLDEAHRGMRTGREQESLRSTIVQRLINGHDGVPPVPIVWGISATVQRFSEAMIAAQAEGRITYPAVLVDPKEVQESGLLKDTIILDFPDEKGAFETTLLKEAIRSLREITELWGDYAKSEGLSEEITPLLVFQVPNKPKERDLVAMLDMMYDEWPELEAKNFAHVFGEHATLVAGSHEIPYIAPQNVEGDRDIRILLAKDAVSTGWDCPRAEVLFSLRPAKDRTHITQLLGRMVRTPLARRVESDERLNAVTCYLPHFDRNRATQIAKILTGESPGEEGPSGLGGAPGRKALTSPVTLQWNSALPPTVQEKFLELPSEAPPKARSKPIKRLLALAAELAIDEMLPQPNQKALEALYAVLDGQLAQHAKAVDQAVEEIYTAEMRRITSTVLGEGQEEFRYQAEADRRTVDDVFRGASRSLGAAVAKGYVKRLVEKSGDASFLQGKARVAALVSVEGVAAAVDLEAERLANSWFNSLRSQIKSLGEERRLVYEDLKRQAKDPQRVDLVLPGSRIENTKDAEGKTLPLRSSHLFADQEGRFPVGSLNEWELAVVDAELRRAEVVAWYRNPATGTANALQVPYRVGTQWKAMRPDFIFFSVKKDGEVVPSLVDPHGPHLSDALPKLRGLAAFAEKYSGEFLRIETVANVDGKSLRMLDLTDSQARAAVGEAPDARSLYLSEVASEYE